LEAFKAPGSAPAPGPGEWINLWETSARRLVVTC
jgi:hypothetical protein